MNTNHHLIFATSKHTSQSTMETIKHTFDMSSWFDFTKIDDDAYVSSMNLTKYTQDGTHLLKFVKPTLNDTNRTTLMRFFRSMIVKDGVIQCVAPDKSISVESLASMLRMPMTTAEDTSTTTEDTSTLTDRKCTFHEYIDGTMVNVYYTGTTWELATRSLIGGKGRFYKESSDTFRTMFLDCMNNTTLDFDDLNINYCYSFVIQHPKNRIVKKVDSPQLYLCAVYKLEGTIISVIDYKADQHLFGKVRYPQEYPEAVDMSNQEDMFHIVRTTYAGYYTNYDIQGVIIECGQYRSKIRNPNYEYVRHLRGNQPKPQYHYLTLRKSGKVKEFLTYYPEYKEAFTQYRNEVHAFTNTLYTAYVQCFIQKLYPLQDFNYEYRPHMVALHNLYQGFVETGSGNYINKEVVIQYVNEMPSPRLMFALNYHKQFEVSSILEKAFKAFEMV